MTQISCASCERSDRQFIGDKGSTVDVYALRGGTGIDSVFQLGVAHAHIVGNLETPQLIVGLSTGAVHAAAIAEILQAPAKLDPSESSPEKRRAAALHRFREILYAYQDFTTSLQGAAFPDAFEADAGRPLRPNPQAIHFQAERKSREKALQARSGLIALTNDLFVQRITVRTLTRLTRAYIGIKATGDLPVVRRWLARGRELTYLLIALLSAPLQCLQLFLLFTRAYVGGTARLATTFIKENKSWISKLVKKALTWIGASRDRGYTAGNIIFSSIRPHVSLGVATVLAVVLVVVALLYCTYHFLSPETFWICLVLVMVIGGSVAVDLNSVREQLKRFDLYDRLLAFYHLGHDLGSDYLIEDLFVRIFDPDYHGKLQMSVVVDRAMRRVDHDEPGSSDPPAHPRTLDAYVANSPSIHVAPFVANLRTGTLLRLAGNLSIVSSLKAAVSRVPFLRPVLVELVGGNIATAVDAANISRDAAICAIDVLREDLHPDAARVRLFSVSPVTAREPSDPASHTYVGAVDVALAAMELSRFRDADDERELIRAVNELLPDKPRPPERVVSDEPRALRCFGEENDKKIHFVKTEFSEIAPAEALHTTGQLLRETNKEARQAVIARAVAEGCRATLAARFGKEGYGCRSFVGEPGQVPGAREVCAHCTAFRAPEPRPFRPVVTRAESIVGKQKRPSQDPTISLLFSGGVFRGVFQIGVLNALNELGVKPNVVAGSSVGSIVAAMVARVLTLAESRQRSQEIAKVAATFMTLDRLIITDRFADFVRRFTLRAAAARFSLRDTDMFFRNFDRVARSGFEHIARRVVGGIEHLFYVSPFELSALVREIRSQNYSAAYDLACRYAQEICDRGQVSFEFLGAEPLSLLIKQHVLDPDERHVASHCIPLNTKFASKLVFLLTATNFRSRQLEIVGPAAPSSRQAALVEALLASSAFPGVFRPRWAREIFFGDNSGDQYIDGGVLDNLPINSVVDYLYAAAQSTIVLRPAGQKPHLVLTASLEPETVPLQDDDAEHVGRSWPVARRRAVRLRYNQKAGRFRDAQRDLRFLYDRYGSRYDPGSGPVGLDTLDVEVVIVKPQWLCDTFGFHPMLGFRRKKQAASIAHGCAATFQTIARIIDPQTDEDKKSDRRWPASAWKMKVDDILTADARTLKPKTRTDGMCHFRENSPCPFAKDVLNDVPVSEITEVSKRELQEIYRLCGRAETHQRAPD